MARAASAKGSGARSTARTGTKGTAGRSAGASKTAPTTKKAAAGPSATPGKTATPGKQAPAEQVARKGAAAAAPERAQASGIRAAFGAYQPWITLLVRVGLAVVWIWASAPKLADPAAAAQEVRNYNIFPSGFAGQLGHIQPYVELALGLLVLVGLGTRITGVISGVLFLAFIGGIVSLWARGIFINCGCFSTANSHYGSASQAGYPAELARDTGFLLMAAWLVVWPRSRFALDRVLLDDVP